MKQVVLAVAGVPLLALFAWYVVSFRTHLSELQSLAKQGQEVKASAGPAFYRLAVLSEDRDRIRSYAIRQAYLSLVGRRQHGETYAWVLNNLLWLASSHLHFNDDQVFGIWIECSLGGCGRGLMQASENYFGKPIKELTTEELAGLVSLVRSPQIYAPGTSKGDERKMKILERYRAGS